MKKQTLTEIQQHTFKKVGRPKITNAKMVKVLIKADKICEFKEVVKQFQR